MPQRGPTDLWRGWSITASVPQSANEFIEQELNTRLLEIESALQSSALAFNGPLTFGVDDILRPVIEETKQASPDRDALAVILTTNGGYIEVVKRIVETIRHYFDYVSFVIPNHAFSAGTVLAMSGNSIHMDYYSRLGPIDPQVQTSNGVPVAALGYLTQWDRLIEKAKAGQLTDAEIHLMVEGFDQGELYTYEQARELSVALLKEWLVNYKFKDWTTTQTRSLRVTPDMRQNRAEEIARALSDPDRWHSHGHGISMDVLRKDLNLQIDDFGSIPGLATPIKYYDSLLSDYMRKRGDGGVVHAANSQGSGKYVPFIPGEV